uniref:CSON010918 protein n=1 Tax=Culicoides sonorensis TaxID=179676 RepID=A0A336M2U4_CULSO
MKYSLILFIMILGLSSLIESKPKKTSSKFEGDFEFVDEDDKGNQPKQATMSEKKKWIHDPSSDLCKPLNCKKKELCLLEDAYTAVCVSKKELHRNRDEIVSKTKFLEAEAKRTADLEDTDELQVQEETEDEDSPDDDVFYDTEDKELDEENCKPCPVVKPTFLCGSDNRTYSSLCHISEIKKQQRMVDRINAFNAKYQKTMQQTQNNLKQQQSNSGSRSNNKGELMKSNRLNDNNIDTTYKFTPEDVHYDNKHYKYIKYTSYENNNIDSNNEKSHKSIPKTASIEDNHKILLYNEVIEKPSNYKNQLKENSQNQKFDKLTQTECKPQQLTAIGNRLLDWFSVIMTDTKKRHTRIEKTKVHFPLTCKMEAKWMFGHLDLNSDGLLSAQEMYDLEHDQNEKCIKPFIDNCDTESDMNLTPREWCRCFEKTDRPCAAVRRRLTGDLVGSYAPDCDIQGFYKSTQCHSSVGETDDDDDDDDDSLEGSADRLLIF